MNRYPSTHSMPDFTPDYFSAHLTDDPEKEPIAAAKAFRELSPPRPIKRGRDRKEFSVERITKEQFQTLKSFLFDLKLSRGEREHFSSRTPNQIQHAVGPNLFRDQRQSERLFLGNFNERGDLFPKIQGEGISRSSNRFGFGTRGH
jgi:hypothetical protein